MFLLGFIFKLMFYISIPLFGILFLPCLISKKATRFVVIMWARFIIFLLNKINGINIIFENNYIERNKGYLIAANHQSVFETIFFLKEFDRVVYIIKKELKFIPIYGWYASRLGNIFLDRKKRVTSMKILCNEVKNLIKKGYKVIIFPEGTRQEEKTIGKFKPGIFAVQKDMINMVYPIYIDSGRAWSKSGKIKRNNIRVKVLSPIQKGIKKKLFLDILRNSLVDENEKNKTLK